MRQALLRREKWRAASYCGMASFILLLALGGCGEVRTKTLCLPLPHYTLQEQKQLADEREADSHSPETDRQIEDWNRFQMRDDECLRRQ